MSTKRKTMSLAMLALLVLSPGAWAEEKGKKVSLDDCLSIAMTNAVTMANARRDRQIVAMQMKQARAIAFPQLSVKGDYTRLDELQVFDMPDGPVELGILNGYSASLNVSQLIFAGGRVSAAIRASRLGAEFSDHNLAETRSSLIRDVRIDFLAVMLTRKAVDVQRGSEAQLKLFAELVKAKFKSGAVSEFDSLAADARYRNVIPIRIGAENAVQLAETALYRRIGVDADAGYVFVGELVPATNTIALEQSREMAMTNRAAIAQLKTTVTLLEERAKVARSGWLPTITAFAALSEANSYGFVSSEERWESHWNAGVTLEWSLFDGGLTRATVREKRLEVEKKSAELEDFKRIVKLEIRQAFLASEQAAKAITASEGAVKVAEKAFILAQARYELGLTTGLDVAEANVALKQARLTLAIAIHDQNVAVARLRHAAGITASTSEPERDK